MATGSNAMKSAATPQTMGVVQSKPKVINTMKRVKEEIIRWTSPEVPYAAGETIEQQLYQGAGMTYYTVRIGEGIELLSLGTANRYDAGDYFDELKVQDFNGSEWNKFHIVPTEATSQSSNTLPFNRMVNFERLMMSWGFRSFLTTNKDVAPTLKMPEGDKLRVFLRNGPSAYTIGAGELVPTCAVVRRFLPGSDIDYKHFDQYDGGIKSTKRYYEDYQQLATTVVGTDTQAWYLDIIRNEAYKFFQAGVIGETPSGAGVNTNLVNARIMIDDPLTEYNKYFVNPGYNNLPINDTSAILQPFAVPPVVDVVTPIEQTHRFAPTIDVLKNRNKDLKLYVRDNGTAVTNVVARFYGVRYVL